MSPRPERAISEFVSGLLACPVEGVPVPCVKPEIAGPSAVEISLSPLGGVCGGGAAKLAPKLATICDRGVAAIGTGETRLGDTVLAFFAADFVFGGIGLLVFPAGVPTGVPVEFAATVGTGDAPCLGGGVYCDAQTSAKLMPALGCAPVLAEKLVTCGVPFGIANSIVKVTVGAGRANVRGKRMHLPRQLAAPFGQDGQRQNAHRIKRFLILPMGKRHGKEC